MVSERWNVSKHGGKYATKVPQRCHEAAVSPLQAYKDRSDIFGPGILAYKKARVGRAQECISRTEMNRVKKKNRDKNQKWKE